VLVALIAAAATLAAQNGAVTVVVDVASRGGDRPRTSTASPTPRRKLTDLNVP
jgi:hypothetical protein